MQTVTANCLGAYAVMSVGTMKKDEGGTLNRPDRGRALSETEQDIMNDLFEDYYKDREEKKAVWLLMIEGEPESCKLLTDQEAEMENALAEIHTAGNACWVKYAPKAPAQPVPGGSVVRFDALVDQKGFMTGYYDCHANDNEIDHSGQYYPAAQVAELVAALKEIIADAKSERLVMRTVTIAETALARFEAKGE